MGKDLKDKELDVGITQESTGLYSARFVDRFRKRKQSVQILFVIIRKDTREILNH